MQRVALFAVRKSVQHYVRTDDGVAGGRTIEMGLKFCQATTESSGTNSSVVGVDRAPSKEYRPSAARMHRCSHYLGVIFLPTVVVLGFMYCGCREYAEVFRGSQYCGYFADPKQYFGVKYSQYRNSFYMRGVRSILRPSVHRCDKCISHFFAENFHR